MISIALFWGASFLTVFLLGFQSRSVNTGRYLTASSSSVAIAITQCTATRLIVSHDWLTSVLVMGTAAPLAVICAMWAHHRLMRHR